MTSNRLTADKEKRTTARISTHLVNGLLEILQRGIFGPSLGMIALSVRLHCSRHCCAVRLVHPGKTKGDSFQTTC